jgi:hypothetical protein
MAYITDNSGEPYLKSAKKSGPEGRGKIWSASMEDQLEKCKNQCKIKTSQAAMAAKHHSITQ